MGHQAITDGIWDGYEAVLCQFSKVSSLRDGWYSQLKLTPSDILPNTLNSFRHFGKEIKMRTWILKGRGEKLLRVGRTK